MNILIIDNDLTIARMEKDYLELSNFKVDIETDGLKGEKLAMSGEYDMLILEVDLSGRSGFEICRKYREIYLKPVIFVSSKEEDIDIIHGFSLGADDYIRKPFRPSELVARVKAHLTRYETLVRYQSTLVEPERDVIISGPLKIDRTSRRVFVDGKEKKLTAKEFSLLFFLASNPNRVFSKEELFHQIWGYSPGSETATLVVHIRKIREKIEKDTANPEFIQTVWGTGYRFRDKN